MLESSEEGRGAGRGEVAGAVLLGAAAAGKGAMLPALLSESNVWKSTLHAAQAQRRRLFPWAVRAPVQLLEHGEGMAHH